MCSRQRHTVLLIIQEVNPFLEEQTEPEDAEVPGSGSRHLQRTCAWLSGRFESELKKKCLPFFLPSLTVYPRSQNAMSTGSRCGRLLSVFCWDGWICTLTVPFLLEGKIRLFKIFWLSAMSPSTESKCTAPIIAFFHKSYYYFILQQRINQLGTAFLLVEIKKFSKNQRSGLCVFHDRKQTRTETKQRKTRIPVLKNM